MNYERRVLTAPALYSQENVFLFMFHFELNMFLILITGFSSMIVPLS